MTIYQRRVRWYQTELYKHITGVEDCRALEIAHRRWGKDEVVLGATNERMHKRVGTYWHCLPEYGQARKAIWTAVNANTGKRRIDEAFPPETRAKTLNDEMFIELKNGSTWQCIGSDRYNATVGAGPVFIAYSEWALANPSAWAYHRPMLEENGGGAAFITTPRGRNHAHAMYLRYKKMMEENPRYFAEISTIHDTGALSPAQLEESLNEYIDLYGEDVGRAQFEQEYECSFTAAILGAFYAREIVQVRKEGRIDPELEAIPGIPVHRAWDIGVKDDTSIWWFQVVGVNLYILDCYSQSGVGVDHYAEVVEQRRAQHGWMDGSDFVPHDARVKEWGTGRTRVETMQGLGLNPRVVPMASKLDGINAVRKTLPRCIFHDRCEERGISALEQYRREWDDDKKAFKANEVHDWSSHLSDAFRYLSMSWREAVSEPIPQHPIIQAANKGLPVMTAENQVVAPALMVKRRY
jgi:phage terminase large subunit